MEQPALLPQIAADIQGDISGQIGVGNHILQIGAIHGGFVTINQPGQQPQPIDRGVAVRLPPRPFPQFVDRESERQRLQTAVDTPLPAQIYGPTGIGKTSLLRALSDSLEGNVIYFRAHHRTTFDVLQVLFDAFYDWPGQKPTDTQIRQALQSKGALVMLDDLDCHRDDLNWLFDVAPRCTFVCTSTKRSLWGEGQAVALRGVNRVGGLALLERELGRPLTADEEAAAEAVWQALEGHPFHLMLAASLVREGQATFVALADRAASGRELIAKTVAQLTRDEQAALMALAALGDAPLDAAHLQRLTANPQAAAILAQLQEQDLVQAHSPRFSTTGDLSAYLRSRADVDSWSAGLLRYFIRWAEQHQETPEILVPDLEAMMVTLSWAVEKQRWADVVRLGRALDPALVLSKQWAAWERMLQWVRQAAEYLGDRAVEGWALHQMGVRALSLEQYEAARDYLQEAVHLRRRIGDRAGQAFSRYHLELLGSPPPPAQWPPANGSVPLPPGPLWFTAGLTMVALLTVLAMIGPDVLSFFTVTPTTVSAVTSTTTAVAVPSGTPTETPTPSPTSTPSGTPSSTPTPTNTPTPTPTNTPTPTATNTPSPPPTLTPTPTPSPTPTATATPSPTPTDTPTPTNTPTPTDTPTPLPPDLVVDSFTLLADPFYRGNQVIAPANVIIRNQGGEPAGPFRVSVEQIASGNPVPFTVPGQGDIRYPATAAPLAPGDRATFSGEIRFTFFDPGETIGVVARADSCAGVELADPACAVEESDESNNLSLELPITLPRENPQADLVVGRITGVDTNCPRGTGSCVTTADVTIINNGDTDAGVFGLIAIFDPRQSVMVEQEVFGLAAGTSDTFTFETPPGDSCFDRECTVCAFADSGQQIDEVSEDNNSLCDTFFPRVD